MYLVLGLTLGVALLLCLALYHWYVLRRPDTPHEMDGDIGFVFSATTTVRRHGTTNLELSVPYPPNFHHDTQPTMTRKFVPNGRR